jgi:hypothetical protein
VPRSDGGRAAARWVVEGIFRKPQFSRFELMINPSQTKRLVAGLPNIRSHQPAPPQPRREQNVRSPDSRLRGNDADILLLSCLLLPQFVIEPGLCFAPFALDSLR